MHPFTLRPDIPPVELAPGVAMSFKVIPPVAVQQTALATGQPLSFMMGSRDGNADAQPRHRVIIPQPFYLGEFPVTQQEFACFRPGHENRFAGRPNHPVELVSWNDAQEFLRWMTETTSLPEEAVLRLPCEAEWEYACRAGTETDYWSGDGEGALEQVGWFHGNAGDKTHPVGKKIENPWGLHDMHGNIWEWCGDLYDKDAYAKRVHSWVARPWTEHDSGVECVKSVRRVLRGGAGNSSGNQCRAACRINRHAIDRNWGHGFRVLLSPPENSQAASQPI